MGCCTPLWTSFRFKKSKKGDLESPALPTNNSGHEAKSGVGHGDEARVEVGHDHCHPVAPVGASGSEDLPTKDPPESNEASEPKLDTDIPIESTTTPIEPEIKHEEPVSSEGKHQREPAELWNKAYEELRVEEEKLTKAYETVLMRISDEHLEDLPEKTGEIQEIDDIPRLKELNEAIQRGLARTKKWAKGTEVAGSIGKTALAANEFISNSLSAFPQAAAAWTAVTLLFQGLDNAATQSRINRDGITYVGSRVDWYCALYSLATDDSAPSRELDNQLIVLFKKVIKYQMRSVGAFYKPRLFGTLLNAFKIHDWDGGIQDIVSEEEDLRSHEKSYYSRAQLLELKKAKEIVNERLDAILNVGTKSLEMQQVSWKKDIATMIGKFNLEGLDYKKFMNANPHPDPGTYQWFVCDPRVGSWNEGLLLLTAFPEQGKSVLARFLVVEGWKEKYTICHFFFKETSNIQKKASNGLCALLHQLLKSHPEVAEIEEVWEELCSQGSGLTTSTSSLWDAISLVLSHIKKTPVILMLDALDECADDEDRVFLLESLASFCKSKAGNVKIMATTRPVKKITDNFIGITSGLVRIDTRDRVDDLALEIDKAIDARLKDLTEKNGWSDNLRGAMKDELKVHGSQQTYLWLRLVFEYLKNQPELRDEDWVQLVKGFTETVNTYDRLLADVDNNKSSQSGRYAGRSVIS